MGFWKPHRNNRFEWVTLCNTRYSAVVNQQVILLLFQHQKHEITDEVPPVESTAARLDREVYKPIETSESE